MEVGKTTELTVLTPGELTWVKRALDTLKGRGDTMARTVLRNGHGRTMTCTQPTTADASVQAGICGKPAAYYSLPAQSPTIQGYCQAHWRQTGDPSNTLGLSNAGAADPVQP